MLKTIASAVIAVLLVTTFWTVHEVNEQESQAPAILKVQEMGNLVSLNVSYSNIIDIKDRITQDIPLTNWELEFGATRVLLLAKGNCLVGTDLKQAHYEHSDDNKKSVDLILPTPKVISARLDHNVGKSGSYFYAVNHSGVSKIVSRTDRQTELMNKALATAQKDIEGQCASADYILAAKKSAEAMLAPLITHASDWRINIVWAKG
jgi:hypothetical protein